MLVRSSNPGSAIMYQSRIAVREEDTRFFHHDMSCVWIDGRLLSGYGQGGPGNVELLQSGAWSMRRCLVLLQVLQFAKVLSPLSTH